MLSLSRKFEEEIWITINGVRIIEIMVTRIEHKGKNSKVTLSFIAPDHVIIDRREVAESKLRDQRDAFTGE